jgi:hyperosmotically inducible protein
MNCDLVKVCKACNGGRSQFICKGAVKRGKMKTMLRKMTLTLAGALLFLPIAQGAVSTAQGKAGLSKLETEVRHELVMLPFYGVFDHFEFQVSDDGKHVTLSGQVTRPTLRTDAERVVERIEGIESVTNNIEVLPLSPMDDRTRLAVARSIFGDSVLSRYSWGPVPPIHIIVKNGNVTLEGVVANETDKNIATIRANGVFGVFSVTNDLRVDTRS